MRGMRHDFNFHVCGAGKVCKRYVVGQPFADTIRRLAKSQWSYSIRFLCEQWKNECEEEDD
jgi:hypothetical protein